MLIHVNARPRVRSPISADEKTEVCGKEKEKITVLWIGGESGEKEKQTENGVKILCV